MSNYLRYLIILILFAEPNSLNQDYAPNPFILTKIFRTEKEATYPYFRGKLLLSIFIDNVIMIMTSGYY
ncbi:hypothetical protein BpHYR1_016346 [Brachionus plicatilis]|uniref:Uncharacterized protein n=1 Tax=Brachionus plicatilis TaxID=10195 RepID=A0A3M7P4I4_BRAPC|nr:hypothetical protein BpHYR1_016346 [Brachionus plicatilis]